MALERLIDLYGWSNVLLMAKLHVVVYMCCIPECFQEEKMQPRRLEIQSVSLVQDGGLLESFTSSTFLDNFYSHKQG